MKYSTMMVLAKAEKIFSRTLETEIEVSSYLDSEGDIGIQLLSIGECWESFPTLPLNITAEELEEYASPSTSPLNWILRAIGVRMGLSVPSVDWWYHNANRCSTCGTMMMGDCPNGCSDLYYESWKEVSNSPVIIPKTEREWEFEFPGKFTVIFPNGTMGDSTPYFIKECGLIVRRP